MSLSVFRRLLSPANANFRLALVVFILGALLLGSMTAAAHTEGVMQLAAEPAGPYMLTVWTSPDPATIDEPLHVAIALVLAEDASPVLEADILVQLTPDDGGPAVSGPATVENSENKFLHEAILDVPYGGAYQVEVTVQGVDGGAEAVSFPLVVEGSAPVNVGLVVVTVAAVATVIFFSRRWLRRSRATSL
jgi:hypothetical protein